MTIVSKRAGRVYAVSLGRAMTEKGEKFCFRGRKILAPGSGGQKKGSFPLEAHLAVFGSGTPAK